MTLEEAIKASKAVLEFLEETSLGRTPKLMEMEVVLNEVIGNSSMIEFTLKLNEQFGIEEGPLWINYAQEFFSNQRSHDFFKKFLLPHIREQKLSVILDC